MTPAEAQALIDAALRAERTRIADACERAASCGPGLPAVDGAGALLALAAELRREPPCECVCIGCIAAREREAGKVPSRPEPILTAMASAGHCRVGACAELRREPEAKTCDRPVGLVMTGGGATLENCGNPLPCARHEALQDLRKEGDIDGRQAVTGHARLSEPSKRESNIEAAGGGETSPAAPPAPVPRGHCGRCARCENPRPCSDQNDCKYRSLQQPRSHCAGCGAPYQADEPVSAPPAEVVGYGPTSSDPYKRHHEYRGDALLAERDTARAEVKGYRVEPSGDDGGVMVWSGDPPHPHAFVPRSTLDAALAEVEQLSRIAMTVEGATEAAVIGEAAVEALSEIERLRAELTEEQHASAEWMRERDVRVEQLERIHAAFDDCEREWSNLHDLGACSALTAACMATTAKERDTHRQRAEKAEAERDTLRAARDRALAVLEEYEECGAVAIAFAARVREALKP